MHAAVVSSLSLEQYLELFHSLTKGAGTNVQPTTALEKNQYKMSALKEVLGVHGLSTGSKHNKQDILDKMAGLRLFDPVHLMSDPREGQQSQSPVLSEQYPELGIDATDIASLGYAAPTSAVQAALDRVLQLSVQPPHRKDSDSSGPSPPRHSPEPQPELEQLEQPQPSIQAVQTPEHLQADDTNALSAIGNQEAGQDIPPEILSAAPPAMLSQHQRVDQVAAAGTGETQRDRQHANSQALDPAPAGCSQAVPTAPESALDAEAQISIPDDSPASVAWLDELTSRLQGKKLYPTQGPMPAALIDHWIVFPLLHTFEFKATGRILQICPGLHPGRVVQFIGRSHEWDVCESDCTAAEHAWHFVRVEAVHKGAVHKFVDLKIDLHPSLHCGKLEALLSLTKNKLQDAWLLLEKQKEPSKPQSLTIEASELERTDTKKRRVDRRL